MVCPLGALLFLQRPDCTSFGDHPLIPEFPREDWRGPLRRDAMRRDAMHKSRSVKDCLAAAPFDETSAAPGGCVAGEVFCKDLQRSL